MHLPAYLLALSAATGLVVGRQCAVCPQQVTEPDERTYRFVSREVQPDNVVCGYAEESRMVERNGWPYCTYNDRGQKTLANLQNCPSPVKTDACPSSTKNTGQLQISFLRGSAADCARYVTPFCTTLANAMVAPSDIISRCFNLAGGQRCDFGAMNTNSKVNDTSTRASVGACTLTMKSIAGGWSQGGSGQFNKRPFKFHMDPNTGAHKYSVSPGDYVSLCFNVGNNSRCALSAINTNGGQSRPDNNNCIAAMNGIGDCRSGGSGQLPAHRFRFQLDPNNGACAFPIGN
ncbi:hypothetical protein FB451DRAFT_1518754 [Mycena latifolia]|nr:hypothetical protein FB451DRAFT_1518754 [Mycena latifolia]